MEIFSPHYSTLLNMFHAELDACKHLYDDHMMRVSGGLYDDHVMRVSGVKTEKLQHGMATH